MTQLIGRRHRRSHLRLGGSSEIHQEAPSIASLKLWIGKLFQPQPSIIRQSPAKVGHPGLFSGKEIASLRRFFEFRPGDRDEILSSMNAVLALIELQATIRRIAPLAGSRRTVHVTRDPDTGDFVQITVVIRGVSLSFRNAQDCLLRIFDELETPLKRAAMIVDIRPV